MSNAAATYNGCAKYRFNGRRFSTRLMTAASNPIPVWNRNRRPLAEPPFTAIALRPSITFTFGGLRVDEACRVLDRHGGPIPGLFAGGVEVGGIYVEQYGGGLGAALALGYAAGDGAAG